MSVKEAQRTVVWVHSHWDTHYAGDTLLCLHYLSTANIMIGTDTLTSAYRFFMYIKWHKKFDPSLVRFFRAPFA